MNTNWGYAIGGAGALMIMSLLGGCDKFTEQFKDAPRTGVENDKPADIIRMPDGFSNMATKCDHGNRLYVVYHGNKAFGSVDVVPQDPTCK